jgi:hypothetical protein
MKPALLLSALLLLSFPPAQADTLFGVQYRVVEWGFRSTKPHPDPFNDLELDVIVTDSQGREEQVPAFWAGDSDWRVRYAPHTTGLHRYRSICSDANDSGLHGRGGMLNVASYTGDNPLYKHGPIRIAEDRRHFQHADATPFFWFGDTWWMGLCQRLRWPEDFQSLTSDRIKKGFTVVQIVAGLYPDMPPFDSRGANEAGYPWEKDYARVNPAYFDMADLRIEYLAEHGLVPCTVGSWGYFLPKMGIAKVKQHWRYLVARWGAYPVVWCLAGEGTMPDYLSPHKSEEAAQQKAGWTEVARYVRHIDPYHRLISIHPSQNSRDTVEDPAVLDFDMLQTGHNDRASLPNTVRQVTGSLARTPRMPVIDAEPCYEGILEAGREEVQRLLFWACVLSGAGGHTYGANGLWQVNRATEPFGPSPHGRSWGDTPWDKASQLPGSAQLGLCKSLLTQYPWWKFEPHPEWVEPHWTKDDYILPYAAGIPGEVRFIYTPARWDLPKVLEIEHDQYRAFLFSPVSGKRYDLGKVTPGADRAWHPTVPPIVQDWVMVLERGPGSP